MYAAPPAIRDLWPTPQLGDWAVRDLNHPVPIPGGDGFRTDLHNLPDNDADPNDDDAGTVDTGIGEPVDPSLPMASPAREPRGIVIQGAYAYQNFNHRLSHVVTHSLGRETLYNWADAQFNVGGQTYPLDYGFGPGYHGDATLEMGNVQVYMRPGVFRRPAPSA